MESQQELLVPHPCARTSAAPLDFSMGSTMRRYRNT